MDRSPFFSPSALGFTPAGVSSSVPMTLDDIMSATMLPTPSKSNESPRLDLNSVLNDRATKDSISSIDKRTIKSEKCYMESASEINFEPCESPEWIKSEVNNPSVSTFFLS